MGTRETRWGRPELVTNINFRGHRDRLDHKDAAEVFDYIYRTNLWGSSESPSGQGAENGATERIRTAIPTLIRKFGVRSIADVPCGDFSWLSATDLGVESYYGADIVADLVRRNRERYLGGSQNRRFERLDLVVDPLPAADLILCRDCLVHLTTEQVWSALRNIRDCGIRYVLTTTFPALRVNVDIEMGDWRPINFQLAPFHFPEPAELIVEGCTEGAGAYSDKALGLWEVSMLETLLS